MNDTVQASRIFSPFNSPVEIGLRAAVIMCANYPQLHSLQRLVILDYLLVHSGDIPDGPPSLHPSTPHRGGELLIRRKSMQGGLALYELRGIVSRSYRDDGVYYAATERSASFLDALRSTYFEDMKERAAWLEERFSPIDDTDLHALARSHVGDWGTEFTMESVLWSEDD